MNSPVRSQGSTILDALTALVVVAVGIIGIAALYVEGHIVSESDEPQRRAAALAKRLGDAIAAHEGDWPFQSAIGVLCNRELKPRDPAEAAANLVACWQDEVEQALPNGLGAVARDSGTSPPIYVITVSWSRAGAGAASYVARVTAE